MRDVWQQVSKFEWRQKMINITCYWAWWYYVPRTISDPEMLVSWTLEIGWLWYLAYLISRFFIYKNSPHIFSFASYIVVQCSWTGQVRTSRNDYNSRLTYTQSSTVCFNMQKSVTVRCVQDSSTFPWNWSCERTMNVLSQTHPRCQFLLNPLICSGHNSQLRASWSTSFSVLLIWYSYSGEYRICPWRPLNQTNGIPLELMRIVFRRHVEISDCSSM